MSCFFQKLLHPLRWFWCWHSSSPPRWVWCYCWHSSTQPRWFWCSKGRPSSTPQDDFHVDTVPPHQDNADAQKEPKVRTQSETFTVKFVAFLSCGKNWRPIWIPAFKMLIRYANKTLDRGLEWCFMGGGTRGCKKVALSWCFNHKKLTLNKDLGFEKT